MKKDWFIWACSFAVITLVLALGFSKKAHAETNTVSSTVVTNNTPPTANAPSVVVNNSDVCKTAASAGVQTQVLGIASGITVTDENCEMLKLSRSLYQMGMKVAAVSTLCSDSRVFDAMWNAGTYCPFQSKIGAEAKIGWEENPDMVPEGSVVFSYMQKTKKEETPQTVRELNDFEKFVIVGMAMYIGVPILF